MMELSNVKVEIVLCELDAEGESDQEEEQVINTTNGRMLTESNRIDRRIAEMIVLQGLPLNFVEGLGIRRLIDTAFPQHNLRGRNFYEALIGIDILNEVDKNVKLLLHSFQSYSFTYDMNSYFSTLLCHGISADFQRRTILLKCQKYESFQTSDILIKNVKQALSYWHINVEKTHCVLVRKLSSTSFHDASINYIESAVTALEQWVIAAINSNTSFQNILSKLLNSQSKFYKVTASQQPPISCWPLFDLAHGVKGSPCSKFQMLQRLAQERPDMKDIQICIYILQPFQETINILNSSETSISSVIPLIRALMQSMQAKLELVLLSSTLRTFIEAVTAAIHKGFDCMKNEKLYAIATYMDPRYKLTFFNELQKQKVETEVIQLICGVKESYTPPEKQPKLNESSSVLSTLTELLEEDIDDGDAAEVTAIKLLLRDYNTEKRLAVDHDPLLWWKNNAKYAKLLHIARQYLAVPASSAASSKFFINDDLWRSMPQKAQDLLFIKHNLPVA